MTQQPTYGYVRVSTDHQSNERQKLEILDYANAQGWIVDRFVAATVSSRKGEKERGLDVIRQAAHDGQVSRVVFAELSRLGRSVSEICRLVSELVDTLGLELVFIKEGMTLKAGAREIGTKVMLTMFSLLAEIERDLISERTKSGLAALKAKGVRLGRPEGKSKLDKRESEIRQWVELGVTQRAAAKKLGCAENTLGIWLKRKRKEWKREKRAKG